MSGGTAPGVRWRTAPQRGMTLIEIMVVVVIIAVLVGIAVPSYRNHIIRTQRTDATQALLRIAAAQEKFYSQNNRYSDRLDLPSPGGIGIQVSENGWYAMTVAADPILGTFTDGFVATAVPAAGSPQLADPTCQQFTIDDQGVRGSDGPVATCWK